MFYKLLILFLIVCIITGVTTLCGSVIGHFIGQKALFAGAVIGGIAGVFLSCVIAGRIKKLQPFYFKPAFTGAITGYIISAITAVNFLHSAFIAAGSLLFTGLGAAAGYYFYKNK